MLTLIFSSFVICASGDMTESLCVSGSAALCIAGKLVLFPRGWCGIVRLVLRRRFRLFFLLAMRSVHFLLGGRPTIWMDEGANVCSLHEKINAIRIEDAMCHPRVY